MYILSNSNLNSSNSQVQTLLHPAEGKPMDQKAASSNEQHSGFPLLSKVTSASSDKRWSETNHTPGSSSQSLQHFNNCALKFTFCPLVKTQSTVYVQVIVQDVSSQFN